MTKTKQKTPNKQNNKNKQQKTKTPYQKTSRHNYSSKIQGEKNHLFDPPPNFFVSKKAYVCSQNTWLLYIKYYMCNKHKKDIAKIGLSNYRNAAKNVYMHILNTEHFPNNPNLPYTHLLQSIFKWS